ncbi:MAG: efflux RND transporter periplasmic adaptor subunit [Candidatus Acidiferrales bacterium]|jgi:RND family efflux transporter MFP subunit
MGHDDTQEYRGRDAAPEQRGRPLRVIAFVIVILIFAGVALWGILSRRSVRASLNSTAKNAATTPVAIVHAQPSGTSGEILLPGNIQAYLETPIYARTNGYLKKWYFDIGAHVKEGQLLAEIETPEIDQELRQAEAAQQQAQANLDLAKTTADRWVELLKSDGVSQQEVDQNVSAYKARQADLQAAKANVDRLKDLQSFKEVTAPFSGIVTTRNVDVGALIQNGNSVQLFRMAQTNVLRIYVNVPQAYSRSMVAGVPADLEIPEFPHRTFPGKVVRTSGSIDTASRTLLTEVQVPNPTGELLPGAYATVNFHVKLVEPPVAIPSNTLIFRSQGTQVAVVTPQGTVHLKSVTLGRDLGTSMEVLTGVDSNDAIILNPPDSIGEGDVVNVKQDQASPADSKAK